LSGNTCAISAAIHANIRAGTVVADEQRKDFSVYYNVRLYKPTN